MSNKTHESNATQPVQLATVSFDLQSTLRSIFAIRTRVSDDATTAEVLGTERAGHGVLIREDGLLLTIGYVVTEADDVWVIDGEGKTMPGHVVGYDQESGFGLVQALGRLDVAPIPLGNSSELAVGAPVVVAGSGGDQQDDHVVNASVIAKHEFAGYWEYLIDDAIFTSPTHPNWGGTALIGMDGRLYGIGSLILQTVDEDGDTHGANMMVPIDLLKPILEELCLYGRRLATARPWLGWYVQESSKGIMVSGVVDGCPADNAGVEAGDMILGVNGASIDTLSSLYRNVWDMGEAGTEIPVTVARENKQFRVVLESVDRSKQLKSVAIH